MSESKHNDTINALKRLERAGDATSEANAKLVAAAKLLLRKIDAESRRHIGGWQPDPTTMIMPVEAAHEHGLRVLQGALPGEVTSAATVSGTSAGSMWQVHLDRVDRRVALSLGEAVAGGLMDSLADWAESRIQAAASATSAMGKAAK